MNQGPTESYRVLWAVVRAGCWQVGHAPPLEPWHTEVPHDLTAADLAGMDWQGYLAAEDRVMAVLREEWADAEAGSSSGRRGWVRWLSVAAVIVALAGAVAWGSVSQVRASHLSEDASAYHTFLSTLGGKDVRVGTLRQVDDSSVQGSVVLVGGDPGIGKSTLALQACGALARQGVPVLYVAGEESPEQVRLRADRLGMAEAGVLIVAETAAEAVADLIDGTRPAAVVVDSIQTLHCAALGSARSRAAGRRGGLHGQSPKYW